jgi:uncharacterized protein (TIGR02453 family)
MKTSNILDFLSQLNDNNNREWFAENKDRYEATKAEFEKISNSLILEISKFDDEIKHVAAKDCVFRIYRDTRFSNDKTPYKTHYGVFIAAGGGRKSVRGGYYFHLEPGKSFVAVGVWCPPPEVLKALRQSVYENIDEFREIRSQTEFSKYFSDFYQEDKLKTAPKGFPKDFPEVELLKLKHYMVEYKLSDQILSDKDFVSRVAEIFKAAHPLNVFLNYTVDEVPR